MVSFRTTLLALASAVVVAGDYYINPDSVSMSTKSRPDAPVQGKTNKD
jgi:hypothetical protein